jgi:hypothetical protein
MMIRFGFDVNVIHVIVIFPREQVRLCPFRFLLGSVRAESFAVDGLARLKIRAVNHDPIGDWICFCHDRTTIIIRLEALQYYPGR